MNQWAAETGWGRKHILGGGAALLINLHLFSVIALVVDCMFLVKALGLAPEAH